jgi:GDSL-like Lipase/Acylhydrolase family
MSGPTLPRPSTHKEPGTDDQKAPRPSTLVAAFGDSLMWGQGVTRNKQFSALTAQKIGALHRRTGVLVFDRSRSGAQIKVRDGSDREDFVDTFPGLFPGPADAKAFLEGDESAAMGLFGEVPASFPTVTWQVESMLPDLGQKIDVALVCGGANDIDFEAILDSTQNQGTFVDRFTGDIREICFEDTLELLGKMRELMPNAVILLFGYFPPMSYHSDLKALKDYFRYELNDDVKWYLNAAANFLGISGSVDVDKAVVEARARSVWAHGLATYWLRRAVTKANRDDAIRGPGIVFVPCGFRPSNSAFTSEPMVSGDYRHPVHDPMQAQRQQHIPRVDALKDITMMFAGVTLENFKGAKALREKIDGPTSLEVALFTRNKERGLTPRELLAKEIYRIHRALIASFFHPAPQGAQQYADMAIARYTAHRDAIHNLPRPQPQPQPSTHKEPGGPEPLEDRLKRFGLRGQGQLRADVGHQFIDAIRVTVSTSRASTKNFSPDIILLLVLQEISHGHHDTVTLQLNMQHYIEEVGDLATIVTKFHPELEPNRTDEFSVDVTGHTRTRQLLLKDLIGMELVVSRSPLPGSPTWLPEDLKVDINGVEVLTRNLRGTRLGPGDSVDLGYPAPVQQKPPVLEPTLIRRGTIPS